MLVACRYMSLEERQMILNFLLKRFQKGVLDRGALQHAADRFGRAKSTISMFWSNWKKTYSIDSSFKRVSSSKDHSITKWINRNYIETQLKKVRVSERTSIRAVASQLRISKTTVHRLLRKEKLLRVHSSGLKPALTTANKYKRLQVSW